LAQAVHGFVEEAHVVRMLSVDKTDGVLAIDGFLEFAM
jgi:hypothetical protein